MSKKTHTKTKKGNEEIWEWEETNETEKALREYRNLVAKRTRD